jgi:hypothetical protein
MANCYLIITSEAGDRLRPSLFVAVAEDEADAIDAFVRGFSDYMALGETASIAGRCEPGAARKMGVPLERPGYAAPLAQHLQ